MSGVEKERKYCDGSSESLSRLVSSSSITVEWRKTEPANYFKMFWAGNCGGGIVANEGTIGSSDSSEQRCDWTLYAPDENGSIEFEITVILT